MELILILIAFGFMIFLYYDNAGQIKRNYNRQGEQIYHLESALYKTNDDINKRFEHTCLVLRDKIEEVECNVKFMDTLISELLVTTKKHDKEIGSVMTVLENLDTKELSNG